MTSNDEIVKDLRRRIKELRQQLAALNALEREAAVKCGKADALAMHQFEQRSVRGRRIKCLREQGETWKEVAVDIGLSVDRVRQIYSRFEAELRHGGPYLPSVRAKDRKAGRWGEGY